MYGPSIREPAVAGLFYPDDPARLRAQVERFIREAPSVSCRSVPKAIVAPHAGYPYSGPTAGCAYAPLAGCGGRITRVVIFGPAHRVGFRGLALPEARAFRTPLGDVPVDPEAETVLDDLPYVKPFAEAHREEHGIEVHLPFLRVVLKDTFKIVPLVVGMAEPDQVAEVMRRLWGGPETLIVISSDLSHYLPYDRAVELDSLTTRSIEALAANEIGEDQACGRIPLAGLLREARRHKLHPVTLDQRNSGDTAGDRRQVVGYGAYAFHE